MITSSSEAASGSVVQKKVFLKILQNSRENTCVRDSFLTNFQATLLKKSLAQVFSCEFCEISKNTFFTEHLRTTVPSSYY